MATLTTLVPTSYITYSGTAPTTTTVGNIDNTVASPDGAFLVFGANSSGTAFYNITNVNSDLGAMTTLTYNIRYKIENLSGDTETLYVRVYKSDRTTALTDEMLVVSTTANIAITNKGNTSFTGVSTTATKEDWDNAVLAIKTVHAANKAADGSVWSVDEVEINGTYNQAVSVALNSPDDSGTTSDTTPDLTFTGTDPEGTSPITYEVQIDEGSDFTTTNKHDLSEVVEDQEVSIISATTIHDLCFGDSGLKLYLITGSALVYQFNLNTAYDLTSASYTDKTLSALSQTTSTTGCSISSDGTKFYVLDTPNETVFQYTLGTAWDLSTGSYASKSYSTSTQTLDLYTTGLAFSSDGTKCYVAARDGDVIFQYTLSTAWDISTASYASKSLDVAAVNGLHGIGFNSDGTVCYVCLYADGVIKNYVLSTAWDISTGSYLSTITIGSGYNITGVTVSSNGSHIIYTRYGSAYTRRLTVNPMTKGLSSADAGFTDVTDGGDTDPFDSGDQIKYTVQSALSAGTYYWRVRGKDTTGSNNWGDWSSTYSFSVTAGSSTATVSPLGIELTPTTTTATYLEVDSATVSPVTTTLTPTATTATYVQVNTASVAPLVVNLSQPEVTATYAIVKTATVAPITTTLTPPAVTATYLEVDSATVSPLSVTATIPEVTATYIQIGTASVSPVGMTLTQPEVTATSATASTATVSPLALTLTPTTTTATFINVDTATVAPLGLTATIPEVTATYIQVGTASVSPLALTLAQPEVTATHLAGGTATVSPVTLTLTAVEVTATYIQVGTATVAPLTTTLTQVEVTATHAEVRSATVSPIATTTTNPEVTATYLEVDSAVVAPLTTTLTQPEVTATYIQIGTAAVSPATMTLTQPEVTATSQSGVVAAVSPLVINITTVSVTATYVQVGTATVSPLAVNITSTAVTATYIQVGTASVAPLTTTLTVPEVTAIAGNTHTARLSPLQIALTPKTVTCYALVNDFPSKFIYVDGELALRLTGKHYTLI
jgi:hypothetical protein